MEVVCRARRPDDCRVFVPAGMKAGSSGGERITQDICDGLLQIPRRGSRSPLMVQLGGRGILVVGGYAVVAEIGRAAGRWWALQAARR